MTRGTPAVNIAIIYPVDSYNILFSSIAESRALREEMEKRYEDTAKWLLGDAFEFDYISESLLPELCSEGTAPLKVGKMKYAASCFVKQFNDMYELGKEMQFDVIEVQINHLENII